MKYVTLILSLLTAGALAQEPACDCEDCRRKAEAAAQGKQFTLPGLEELNKPAEHKHEEHQEAESHEGHDHAEHEGHDHAEQPESACTDGCAHDHVIAEADHSEHVHAEGEACGGHEDHDHSAHAVTNHDDHDHAEGETCGSNDGHDHEEAGLQVSAEMAAKIGLKVEAARGGLIHQTVTLPAEIKLNRDQTAAVSPRYDSSVRQVFAEIGDAVKKGDVLASLENRETLAVYTVSAPLDGVIIAKDLAVGESVDAADKLFEVANLSSVWADISVFPKYQHTLRKGASVTFVAHDGHTAKGTVQYISPIVSHETRTFTARCILTGADEDFTPGAFVRARIIIKSVNAAVRVPREAIQTVEGESVVFIADEHGFESRPVKIGLQDSTSVEIISGLKPGEKYAAHGAFALKAEMVTSGMDPHAGHGH